MSFNTGLSGLRAASAELGVIGNNIANAGTWGFKGSRSEFSDVYANSVLGAGGTSIGMGVQLSAVTQQFSQGNPTVTENPTDFSVNGPGFFCLDYNGQTLYTRAGAFQVDNQGNVVNSIGAKLLGYMPDYSTTPGGTISSIVGPIVISTASIPPQATTAATYKVNLDSAVKPLVSTFVTGFTPTNPPVGDTYNYSQSQDIYDSLGNKHLMTLYFVKQNVDNQWQVFTGIDGYDVTPGASVASPKPFTAVFDSSGNYVTNNPTNPPIVTQSATISTAAGQLVSVGGLPTLNSGDLVINGIPIGVPASDGISSAQNNASAAAIYNAIVAASIPSLTASVVPATVSLGAYTPPTPSTTAFGLGDFVVNGVDLSTIDVGDGNGVFQTAADLAAAISTITGLSASVSGSDITIDATDGRNIQLRTNGSAPTGTSLGNFALDVSGDYVKRGEVQIIASGAESINISGNAPLNGGFVPGTFFAQVDYANSDVMNVINWDPENGAAPQSIQVNMGSSTQFGSPFSVSQLVQNGSTTGRLVNINTDNSGVISASFSDGRTRLLGQMLLANFANQQGLQSQGNTMWSQTFASGNALLGIAGTSGLGVIDSGQLEESNVDLTEELVSLIVAQRNFQANAQTIQTEDATTQTIINLQ